MKGEQRETVYLISQGSYSDYRVVAILTDRTEAEAFCREHGFDFDPIVLDAIDGIHLRDLWYKAEAELATGKTSGLGRAERTEQAPYKRRIAIRREYRLSGNPSKPFVEVQEIDTSGIVVVGWGRTAEAARQSASDNRRELVATGKMVAASTVRGKWLHCGSTAVSVCGECGSDSVERIDGMRQVCACGAEREVVPTGNTFVSVQQSDMKAFA